MKVLLLVIVIPYIDDVLIDVNIFVYRIVTTSPNRDDGGECPYVWILLRAHSDLCTVTIVSIFKLKNICIK